jgi:hypothetical protein
MIRYARRLADLRESPMPAVLDTSCVRTSLHDQLALGRLERFFKPSRPSSS